MASRRSLGLSHLPIHLPQDSASSQSSLTSPPLPINPTVQDLVVRLEATQDVSRRRSSEGDLPHTPVLRILSRRASAIVSRTPSLSNTSPGGSLHARPELGTLDDDEDEDRVSSTSQLESELVELVLTKAEKQSILGPYSHLPLPPKTGDLALSGYPHFPSTPLARVTNELDDFGHLPPLPDSPVSQSSLYRSPKAQRAVPAPYDIVEVSPLSSPLFSPRLPVPQSPLSIAVDSAADADSPPISPPTFYELEPNSTVSFNTAVRDLVQEVPDQPIGGTPAVVMEKSSDPPIVGKEHPDTPKIQVTSPGFSRHEALRSSSNFSDPWRESYHRRHQPSEYHDERMSSYIPTGAHQHVERPISPMSDMPTPPMVTAPDTPGYAHRVDHSQDPSYDGAPGSIGGVFGGSQIRDFAAEVTKEAKDLASEVTEEVKDLAAGVVKEVEGGHEDHCPDCGGCRTPPDQAPGSNRLKSLSGTALGAQLPGIQIGAGQLASAAAGNPLAGQINATQLRTSPNVKLPTGVPSGGGQIPGLNSVAGNISPQLVGVPAVPMYGGVKLPGVPGIIPVELAVPADMTGALNPPDLSKKQKKQVKRRKAMRKGQNTVRRGRSVVLRTPVLALIVGRQLAGPTSMALKQISKGVPIDASTVTDNVPVAAPLPVPVPV